MLSYWARAPISSRGRNELLLEVCACIYVVRIGKSAVRRDEAVRKAGRKGRKKRKRQRRGEGMRRMEGGGGGERGKGVVVGGKGGTR